MHLFFHDRLDHFISQLVNGFHFGRLESEFANFNPQAARRAIHLNLDHLALNHLCLFSEKQQLNINKNIQIN